MTSARYPWEAPSPIALRGSAWQGTLLVLGISYGLLLCILTAALLGIPSRILVVPYRMSYVIFAALIMYIHRHTLLHLFRASLAMKAFCIFWCFYGIRLLLDLYLDPPQELRLRESEYLQLAIGGALIPALAFATAPNLKFNRKLLLILATTGFLTLLVAIYLFRDILGTQFGRVGGSQTEIAFGSLNTGYLASSVLTLALFIIIEHAKLRTLILGVVLFLPALVGIALGASRGPVIAVIACLAAMLLAKLRTGGLGWVATIAAIFALALPHLTIWFADLGSNLANRFEVLFLDERLLGTTRAAIWSDCWRQFLEAPLLGSGIDDRSRIHYPHNIIIESFMTTGMIGGMAFLIFLAGALRSSFALLSHPATCHQIGWVALLAIHYTVNAMVSGALYTNFLFWAFATTVISLRIHYLPAVDPQRSPNHPAPPFPAHVPQPLRPVNAP
ncbi:MAG TPA: O-antigen ligase family protein [Kiritimatiellia bacterium]|mgnify:CR=1 FL=1|nr:O-antigen ligase family protein [Kiritimatiellia bacterium]